MQSKKIVEWGAFKDNPRDNPFTLHPIRDHPEPSLRRKTHRERPGHGMILEAFARRTRTLLCTACGTKNRDILNSGAIYQFMSPSCQQGILLSKPHAMESQRIPITSFQSDFHFLSVISNVNPAYCVNCFYLCSLTPRPFAPQYCGVIEFIKCQCSFSIVMEAPKSSQIFLSILGSPIVDITSPIFGPKKQKICAKVVTYCAENFSF